MVSSSCEQIGIKLDKKIYLDFPNCVFRFVRYAKKKHEGTQGLESERDIPLGLSVWRLTASNDASS